MCTVKMPEYKQQCNHCFGTGKVNRVMPPGTVMCYCGPNGENWPQEICHYCGGTGYLHSAGWELIKCDKYFPPQWMDPHKILR